MALLWSSHSSIWGPIPNRSNEATGQGKKYAKLAHKNESVSCSLPFSLSLKLLPIPEA